MQGIIGGLRSVVGHNLWVVIRTIEILLPYRETIFLSASLVEPTPQLSPEGFNTWCLKAQLHEAIRCMQFVARDSCVACDAVATRVFPAQATQRVAWKCRNLGRRRPTLSGDATQEATRGNSSHATRCVRQIASCNWAFMYIGGAHAEGTITYKQGCEYQPQSAIRCRQHKPTYVHTSTHTLGTTSYGRECTVSRQIEHLC